MNTFSPLHSFHIPVMGLAFTIDSPVKVARFGISSVVSIIEDRLIETMRRYYYEKLHLKYKPISTKESDYRARRITDYLNLLNKIVHDQVENVKRSAFTAGSEIVKYFELLPDQCTLKELYTRMTKTSNEEEKDSLQSFLRSQVRPGSIDVNIMTKVDKNNFDSSGTEVPFGSDALSALRGYANSDLTNTSIVFSAGMNPRLFTYLENFADFDPVAWGDFKKRIILKVSDYRSALIQGKVLAKKGIWVSEFRIESGLNCGGHAFATDGFLLGPILQEFRDKRESLREELHNLYFPVAQSKGKKVFTEPHPLKVSVQGGIGTADEDRFLHDYYNVDSTGWGTPFLLCPEATTVDDETLKLLQDADENSIELSQSSPLGVPFHYLKGTSGEAERMKRISRERPGSPCTEKHLVTNTEFTTKPICTASQTYQVLKLEQLRNSDLSVDEYQRRSAEVLAKECLCVGLSNSASLAYNTPFLKKLNSVTICPGPNIINFSKISSLAEMVDHIYGRGNVMTSSNRPHMFIKELQLYLDHLKDLMKNSGGSQKERSHCDKFQKNISEGIEYYRTLPVSDQNFQSHLSGLEEVLKKMSENYSHADVSD